MDKTMEVLSPATSHATHQYGLHKVDTLSGRVVGFIDNGKPNFSYLVDDLAQLLTDRYHVAAVIKRQKRGAGVPAPEAIIEELAQRCDVVITGSGD